jgi:hypothetical protein
MAVPRALWSATFAWAQDVSYNAMPGTDLTKCKTYKWVTIEGAMHTDQEKQWNAYGGGGLRWGGMGTVTSSMINIGTLDIDRYDQAGKQLDWRGSATKTFDDNPKPHRREKTSTRAWPSL